MTIKCLAVDSDFDIASCYVMEWANRGVSMDCAGNMTDAIQKLQNNKYIFVGINGDAIDFMPLLSTMRSTTNTPIMIATSSFTTEKEIAALGSGADLYARWHKSPKDNVSSVFAHISRKAERKDDMYKVLIYNDLLVSPLQRKVFIGNTRLDLTRQEFDILYYLMNNIGYALTYDQIYDFVWKNRCVESVYDTVKTGVRKVRKKLSQHDNYGNAIETVRGVGYRLCLSE